MTPPLAVRASALAQFRVLCVRRALSTASPAPLDMVLYRYQICPFCCKVEKALQFFGLPADLREVNPLTKTQLAGLPKDYRKVPIALVDGEQINESNRILDRIHQHVEAHPAATSFFSADARACEEWSDNTLAVVLFPNITRTLGESYATFGYVHTVPSFSIVDRLSNQLVGSVAMWLAHSKLKKKYGITDERAALREALDHWVAKLEDKPFAGGDAPHAGDISVYGALFAIRGLDAHSAALEDPALHAWYDRVGAAIAQQR